MDTFLLISRLYIAQSSPPQPNKSFGNPFIVLYKSMLFNGEYYRIIVKKNKIVLELNDFPPKFINTIIKNNTYA